MNQWNTLAQGLAPGTAAQLDRPMQVAEDLSANWSAWGLHDGVDFSAPPAGLPQQAYDDFKTIAGDPTLSKALAGGGGNTIVTLASVQTFLGKAQSDLQAGSAAYAAYLAANPGASASARDVARQTAIVDANLTLISSKGDGRPSQADISGFGADAAAAGLYTLSDATNLIGQSGVFSLIDSAGRDPSATANDDILNQDNITAWLKGAPVTDADVQSLLSDVSLGNALSSTDTSGLSGDIISNPSHYAAAQKAAVLQQLEKTLYQYQSGVAEDLADYPNAVVAGTERNLTNAIDTLSQDSAVQDYMTKAMQQGIAPIIANDTLLSSDINQAFQTFKSSGPLNATLKTSSLPDALTGYIKQYNFFNSALGLSGQGYDGPGDVLSRSNPDIWNLVLQYSNEKIINAGMYTDMIAQGEDPTAAVQQYLGMVSIVSALVPTSGRAALTAGVRTSFMDAAADQVLSSGSMSDLARVFGDATGNVDDAKLRQALQQNPAVFTDGDGTPISPDTIVSAFKNVWNVIRGGAKVTDALGKLGYPALGNQTIQTYYGQGTLHAVSALLGAGLLSAEGVGGADAGGLSSTALTTFGTALEASSKYMSKTGGSGLSADELKTIESGGKAIGGIGSALGGGLALVSGVNGLASGDTADAAINISSGVTGLFAAGGTLTDGLVGGAAALGVDGLSTISAGIAAAAGSLSIVAGVAGIAGLAAESIIGDVKKNKRQDDFSNVIDPVLEQYGLAAR